MTKKINLPDKEDHTDILNNLFDELFFNVKNLQQQKRSF